VIETHPHPIRLRALPMFLMLALTRQGYRHAVRSKLEFRMPDYAVMAILAEFGASDQRTIVDRAGFDKSDVTKIINRLEGKSLVQRSKNEADRRRHRVALTAKGRRQLAVSDKELVASMKVFLRGLDAEEYHQLQHLLLKAIQVHDQRFAPDPSARPST
jgi:MarR family transcriptional regulator, lower aerobic nicotinate degradation pathway regulator